MSKAIRKVNIFGHLSPDTDSICAAISYAYLKNQIGDPIYEARRAGTLNRETAFVLEHFGFEEPDLITSVSPQIKDISVLPAQGVAEETSLFGAWRQMTETGIDTLCTTGKNGELTGLITLKDIAKANLDIFDENVLSTSGTKYSNIANTLDGQVVVGDGEAIVAPGGVRVGTNPEMLEKVLHPGDIVLVTNRYETQRYAVDSGVSCLIVCNGADINKVVREMAEERGCTIITTPHDTYATARLITMSIPVRAKAVPEDNVIHVTVDTPVADAGKTMTESKHRYLPVIDNAGRYAGLLSAPNLLDIHKKHVILVDHNERTQAVHGLEEAEIMEIVDHHRIGSIETSNPVLFRNEPVGCTCTIIYSIYQENGVEIPANIAGLMLSAILSDTLVFQSPTCTQRDKEVGEALAKIAGVDIDEYAEKMFDAGASLEGRSAEEVFHQDFKVFARGDVRFGVGQGSFVTENSRRAAEALVGPYMADGAAAHELPLVFYMFTDVRTQTTDMMAWGENFDEVLTRAFGVAPEGDIAVLPGVVSRKKQVTPALMDTLLEMLTEQNG